MSPFSRLLGTLPTLAVATVVSLVAASAASAQSDVRPRTVAVAGQGEVEAEPDLAMVTLGIQVRAPKVEDARNEVNQKVEAVLKLTRELNIDPKQVRSLRINVQPEYDYNRRERPLLGYFVTRQVEVELRNLDQLGPLMERSTNLGVNLLSAPRLESSKRRQLEREALGLAVADARLNAEALVKAAGGRLGPVRSMSASSNTIGLPVERMAALRESSTAAEESYQPGQIKFTASVQIEYDLAVDAAR